MISVDHRKSTSENYAQTVNVLRVRNDAEANAPQATCPVVQAIETDTRTGLRRTANDPPIPAIEHRRINRLTLNAGNRTRLAQSGAGANTSPLANDLTSRKNTGFAPGPGAFFAAEGVANGVIVTSAQRLLPSSAKTQS